MQDLKYLHALNSIPGVGLATLRALKNNLGNFETAWAAGEEALRSSGVRTQELQAILWKRPSIHPDREMEKLIRENVWLVTEDDEKYPERLKEISNPPLLLYGRGDARILKNDLTFGVVGTRRPTHYGLEATENIVHGLVEAGVTTVSGLATGIDARSHEATLEAGGKTIAVLGSGVDPNSIFPPENKGLARRIAESGGAVISEYAPGTPAVKEHFPARNRIIAGLSRGVLVVEAREKSGALITARFALEQNRDVFALPGPIFSLTSTGPNKLIQEGAKLILGSENILEEWGMGYNESKGARGDRELEGREKQILESLEEALGVDALQEKTGMETSQIIAALSMLELKGRIRSLGNDTYQKM
mgnify:CR=1 FL=1